MQSSLFDNEDLDPELGEVAADPGDFPRTTYANHLFQLSERGVHFGVSSWKYEGWLGSIYSPSLYEHRGKFSKKRFEESCLAEYAQVFPIVCGDFSFYRFPSASFWDRLFATAPSQLKFAFKVPEFITLRVFPNLPRWASLGGLNNETFLDYRLLETNFLELLRPYRHRVSCLIFEFSPFPKGIFVDELEFAERLEKFLHQLPDEFRYAVEIRNHELFGPTYLEVLREHRIAHVLNAWTRMPTIGEQMEQAGVFTTNFTVARALLRQGRTYEEAVAAFEPYRTVQDPNPETRISLYRLAERALRTQQQALLFVNNRLEGNAPGTIKGVLELGL
jgi:uncharacterized protein YecE (DUF72 family)